MQKPPSRRRALIALLAAAAVPGFAANKPTIEVWKSPTCGCCVAWVEHLRAHGFEVRVTDTAGPAQVRERLGMPSAYGSCHTARVQGYVVEGHVPAEDIRRLLAEKPDALGLAVPAMPVGSPGMDGPEYGGRRDPYDVLLVARDGRARVWRSVQ